MRVRIAATALGLVTVASLALPTDTSEPKPAASSSAHLERTAKLPR
ncbi:hypothetical protein ACTWJ9_07155 [Streptomyces sp. GDS52]